MNYQLSGQSDRCSPGMDAADKIAEEHPMDFLKGSLARYLGKSYLALKNNSKGIFYLNKALSISEQSNDSETLTDVYKQLYTAYASTGDYKKAFDYSVLHFHLKDSIYGIEKEKAINELGTRWNCRISDSGDEYGLLLPDIKIKKLQCL